MKSGVIILIGAIGFLVLSIIFTYFTNFTCPYFGFKCMIETPTPSVLGATFTDTIPSAPTTGTLQCPPNSSYDQAISDCRCLQGYVTSADETLCMPLQCS